jgi:hypothetical protein
MSLVKAMYGCAIGHGRETILKSFMEVPMKRLSGLMALVAFLSFGTMSTLAFAGDDKKDEGKDKGKVVVFGDEKKDEGKDKGK